MGKVVAIPQVGKGLLRMYMKSKYVQSLERAGATARWIELEDPELAVKQALECDALLLAGGADVAPELYGQTPTEKCGKVDPVRDKGEWAILEAFLPTNKPILCVCRGMQLLNVFFGGTMHQDIVGIQACCHQKFHSRAKGSHHVKLMPRTKLSGILGKEKAWVNSIHHQAVDQLGPGLNVSAVSEDGFIEGLELLLHPFCVGVQWHPEHLSSRDQSQQAVFDAFVAACEK